MSGEDRPDYVVANEIVLESNVRVDSATRAKIHLGLLNQLVDVRKGVIDTVPDCGLKLRVLQTSPSGHEYLCVTSKTALRFTDTCGSSVVFSLDLSPSMNVVDTSFKGFNTGCYLIESLEVAVRLALEALLFAGREKVHVTVVAQGMPEAGMKILVLGEQLVDRASITQVIRRVKQGLGEALNDLSTWVQKNREDEQVSAKMNCSRTRLPCISQVCKANDVSEVIRNCMLASSLAYTKISPNVLVGGLTSSIVLVTDGVLFHPRRLQYDNILMQLNTLDFGLHVIQVGGGFAPWSALGFVSDPDLIRMLASSTPNGLYVQDHHIASMLYRGNPLEHALLTRTSPIAVNPKHERMHVADTKFSYQSSLIVSKRELSFDAASPFLGFGSGGGSPKVHSTYIEHLKLLGVKRSESIVLQGILVPPPSPGASSPGMPRKNSFETLVEDEEERGADEYYVSPEKLKARPFLYKTYLLPGVSLAKLLECRVREGFVVEAVSEKEGHSVRLSLPWGVTMEVIYEIVCSGDQELRIKIHLRMPSGNFFLKFKQAASVTHSASLLPGTPNTINKRSSIDCSQTATTNFVQLCRQLDGFIEGVFSVDDALAKMTMSTELLLATDSDCWHRWLVVQPVYLVLTTTSAWSGRGTDFAASSDAVLRALSRWASTSGGVASKPSAHASAMKFVKEVATRDACPRNTALITKFFPARAKAAAGLSQSSSAKVYVDASLRSSASGVYRLTVGFDAVNEVMHQRVILSIVDAVNEQLASTANSANLSVQVFLEAPVSLKSLVAKPTKTPFVSEASLPCEFSLARWVPNRDFVDSVVTNVKGERSLDDASTLQTFVRRRISEGWRKLFEQDGTLCLVYFLQVADASNLLSEFPLEENDEDFSSTEDESDFDPEDDVQCRDIVIDWSPNLPRNRSISESFSVDLASTSSTSSLSRTCALVLTVHYIPPSHRHGTAVTYTLAADGAGTVTAEALEALDRRLWESDELDLDEFRGILGLTASSPAPKRRLAKTVVLAPGASAVFEFTDRSGAIHLADVISIPRTLGVDLELVALTGKRVVGRVRRITSEGVIRWPRDVVVSKVKIRNHGNWTCVIGGIFNLRR